MVSLKKIILRALRFHVTIRGFSDKRTQNAFGLPRISPVAVFSAKYPDTGGRVFRKFHKKEFDKKNRNGYNNYSDSRFIVPFSGAGESLSDNHVLK